MHNDYVKALGLPALGRCWVLTEVERIYTCVICHRAWVSKQSLRAHMKRHKGQFIRTTVYAKAELWKRFDEVCRKHKTTTCALLDVLIKATLAGEETGNIDLSKIGSANPINIQVTEYFLAQPRSRYKIPFSPPEINHGLQGAHCPSCGAKEIRQFKTGDGFVEGRCVCGAEWLIHPSQNSTRVT